MYGEQHNTRVQPCHAHATAPLPLLPPYHTQRLLPGLHFSSSCCRGPGTRCWRLRHLPCRLSLRQNCALKYLITSATQCGTEPQPVTHGCCNNSSNNNNSNSNNNNSSNSIATTCRISNVLNFQ